MLLNGYEQYQMIRCHKRHGGVGILCWYFQLSTNIMHLETSKCINVVEGIVLGSMPILDMPSFENSMN